MDSGKDPKDYVNGLLHPKPKTVTLIFLQKHFFCCIVSHLRRFRESLEGRALVLGKSGALHHSLVSRV